MAFDIKAALGAIAPTLATMMGGPLAGTAVSALVSAFGITSSGDQIKDTAAITKVVQDGKMTPEIIAAVRKADQEHEALMGQQGIDLAKLNAAHEAELAQIYTGDVQDARKRQMETKDDTPKHLAYMMIIGFFVLSAAQLIAIMGWPEYISKIPPEGWLIVGNISGYLIAEAKQAAAFFLGSTAASKGKDATIQAQANALNVP